MKQPTITDKLRYIGTDTKLSGFYHGGYHTIHSIDHKGVWVLLNGVNYNENRRLFYHMEFHKHFEIIRENPLPVGAVTLTKAQANAIEAIKELTDSKDLVLLTHASHLDIDGTLKSGWESERLLPLNELSLEQLATALLVGYEIQLTSEEKALEKLQYGTPELYEIYQNGSPEYQKGVLEVLLDESKS